MWRRKGKSRFWIRVTVLFLACIVLFGLFPLWFPAQNASAQYLSHSVQGYYDKDFPDQFETTVVSFYVTGATFSSDKTGWGGWDLYYVYDYYSGDKVTITASSTPNANPTKYDGQTHDPLLCFEDAVKTGIAPVSGQGRLSTSITLDQDPHFYDSGYGADTVYIDWYITGPKVTDPNLSSDLISYDHTTMILLQFNSHPRTEPAPAPTDLYALIFYVEKDGFPSGHGFMQFWTNVGSNAYRNDMVYGLGCAWGTPWGPGFLRGPGAPQKGLLESKHPWDWRIAFFVTPSQYNAAVNFVNSAIKNPPTYNLLTSNCVDFIKAVARAAGLSLPPSTRLDVSDPYILASSCEAIGNGHFFAGLGHVEQFNNRLPDGTPDPPAAPDPLASPYDALLYALQDPAALAAASNMTLLQNTLRPVTLGAGELFTLNLINQELNTSFVIMDFGDGSNATVSSQLSHRYASGTYEARIIALTAGGMDEYLVNITALDGSTEPASLSVSLPTYVVSNQVVLSGAEEMATIAPSDTVSPTQTPTSYAPPFETGALSPESPIPTESYISSTPSGGTTSFSLISGTLVAIVLVVIAIGVIVSVVVLSAMRKRKSGRKTTSAPPMTSY